LLNKNAARHHDDVRPCRLQACAHPRNAVQQAPGIGRHRPAIAPDTGQDRIVWNDRKVNEPGHLCLS
jgi:hypothetical protein